MNLTPTQKLWIASWQTLSVFFPKTIAHVAQMLFLTPEKIARPPSEFEFFSTAKKYKIDDRIAAFEWGQQQNPLVLLVHGWAGRGTQMAAFAAPLVRNGFRVVAVDGPAHGDSAGKFTHVGEYSQFMIDIQKTLGPYHSIIAHSFGAGCAVLSASRGLNVKKIVMVAGPSRYELVVKNYLDAIKISPKARQYFIDSLGERVKLPVTEMNVGVIGNQVPNLKAMVVHDKEDKEVTVRAAEDIKKNWPSIEFMMTTGLGHRRILKDPLVVNAVTEFILKELAP
tara:strand:+ start:12252 stop:13094 length:843 start_codon:yes stop_codon:yes gene_type:complete